jgi:cellulose synthase/poly-beta-1,6-N-acetylglucosamine synthase-like glycosyltransferase
MSGPNPLFSVVIPTYKNDTVLEQCLHSLVKQSVDKISYEVIIVNDGGRGDVLGNLGSLGGGVSVRGFSQDHKGPAAARNLGISKAKGDIILFLDDDSLPTKDWFRATERAWKRYPDSDGIGGYTISEPSDSLICRVNTDIFNWYLEQNTMGEYCTFLSTHNAGYRRAVLNKVGRFDERFKGAQGEDRDLNIKISKRGGKLRLSRDILVYHDRDLSLGSFFRKYSNYGRAAHELSQKYPNLERLSVKGYLLLWTLVLKRYGSFPEKIAAFLLLTLSQSCTFFGYQAASFTKRRQKRRG